MSYQRAVLGTDADVRVLSSRSYEDIVLFSSFSFICMKIMTDLPVQRSSEVKQRSFLRDSFGRIVKE